MLRRGKEQRKGGLKWSNPGGLPGGGSREGVTSKTRKIALVITTVDQV